MIVSRLVNTRYESNPGGQNFEVVSVTRREAPDGPLYEVVIQPDEWYLDPFAIVLTTRELFLRRKWVTACLNRAAFYPRFRPEQKGPGSDAFICGLVALAKTHAERAAMAEQPTNIGGR